MEIVVLYFTVIKPSIDLSFSSRNKQHCTSCWNSNVWHICYIICCLSQENLNLKKKKIIKSYLSHIVLLKNNCSCYNIFAFYSFKNVQDWLYAECYPLQQIMYDNWHKTTTVHLVILMWTTSCKISLFCS